MHQSEQSPLALDESGESEPLGKILNVLEQGLLSATNMDDMENNPMFGMMQNQPKQNSGADKKQDSQTPALDFFCTDLT